MMLQFVFVSLQISLIAGFSKCRFLNQHKVMTPSYRVSTQHMSASDDERPRVQIKRIVESLSSGEKSGSEVELELKALQTDGTLLDLSTAVTGSLIGLVAGGLLDGALAHGNAPWAGPVGYAVLGGAAYYGATQKKNADVSQTLRTNFGRPTLNIAKSAVLKIQTAVAEAKASAIKKVEETVDDIVSVPTKIRESIVDAKDEAVTSIKAIPVNLQNAATKSYEDAKQSAIQKVDNKVAELKAIPVAIQEKSASVAKNAQILASKKAEDIVDDIKATPQRLLDAAILKAAETAADIRKIPDTAISKAQTAYNAKKLEITSTIDKNVKSLQSAVDSVIPSDDRKAI